MLVLKQLIILAIFIIIGYILRKKDIISSGTAAQLSRLEFWLFNPALCFKTFAANFNVTYIKNSYNYIVYSVVIIIALMIVGKVMSKVFTKDKYEQGVYAYTLTVSNYGYMGYPIMEALYGSEMLLNMMMFALPMSLYVYTEGYRALTGSDKFSFRSIINPGIVAIFVGCIVGLSGVILPTPVNDALISASNCMAPVAMLMTGIVLADYNILDIIKRASLYIVSLLRLLVIPLALVMCLKAVNADKSLMVVAVITYAMPSGLNPIIFSKLVGKDSRIGAGIVLVSNVMLLITLPFIMKFI